MNRPSLRVLLRSTLAYSLVSLAGPLMTIVLTPIYTRVMGQEDYGAIELVRTFGMIASVFGKLGLDTALSVYLYRQSDSAAQDRLVSLAIWLGACCSGIIAVLLCLLAQPLASAWLGNSAFAFTLALYVANLPFGAVFALNMTALRLRQETSKVTLLGLLQVLLLAGLGVTLVAGFRLGAVGALGAEMATYVLLAIVSIAAVPRHLSSAPQAFRNHENWQPRDLIGMLLIAGLPQIPAGIAIWALGYIDRPLLVQFGVSVGDIGVYAIAGKLASMLALVSIPFQAAWTPFALSIQDHEDAPHLYARVLTLYCAAMLGVVLLLGLFAHEILWLFTGEKFMGAQQYVWVLAYAAPLQGVSAVIMTGLLLARKTVHMAWTATVGAAVNILLNLVLIPWLGITGAAIATPLGFACGPIATYLVAQRSYRIPYRLGAIGGILVVQALLMSAGLWFSGETTLVSITIRVLLVAVYGVVLLLSGIIRREDLLRGWTMLRQRFARLMPKALHDA